MAGAGGLFARHRYPEPASGVGQPFAGAVADRFGTVRVLMIGTLLYAAGQVVMAYAVTPGVMTLGVGVLVGFGLSGASFNLVLGASASCCRRTGAAMALGAGTAAGSLGQFLFPPIGSMLIESLGWQQTVLIFSRQCSCW